MSRQNSFSPLADFHFRSSSIFPPLLLPPFLSPKKKKNQKKNPIPFLFPLLLFSLFFPYFLWRENKKISGSRCLQGFGRKKERRGRMVFIRFLFFRPSFFAKEKTLKKRGRKLFLQGLILIFVFNFLLYSKIQFLIFRENGFCCDIVSFPCKFILPQKLSGAQQKFPSTCLFLQNWIKKRCVTIDV